MPVEAVFRSPVHHIVAHEFLSRKQILVSHLLELKLLKSESLDVVFCSLVGHVFGHLLFECLQSRAVLQ